MLTLEIGKSYRFSCKCNIVELHICSLVHGAVSGRLLKAYGVEPGGQRIELVVHPHGRTDLYTQHGNESFYFDTVMEFHEAEVVAA